MKLNRHVKQIQMTIRNMDFIGSMILYLLTFIFTIALEIILFISIFYFYQDERAVFGVFMSLSFLLVSGLLFREYFLVKTLMFHKISKIEYDYIENKIIVRNNTNNICIEENTIVNIFYHTLYSSPKVASQITACYYKFILRSGHVVTIAAFMIDIKCDFLREWVEKDFTIKKRHFYLMPLPKQVIEEPAVKRLENKPTPPPPPTSPSTP